MKPAPLSRSSDFRRVYGEGRRTRRNGVGIAALQRGDDGPARVGYVVKKSVGGAVTRNRIKRRLRAATSELELQPGLDLVVSGDREVALLDFQVLVEKLRSGVAGAGTAR